MARSLLVDFINQSDQHEPGTAVNVNFPDNYHLENGQILATNEGSSNIDTMTADIESDCPIDGVDTKAIGGASID